MRCKDCKFWNDFAHTYIIEHENGYDYDCCSNFHIAYMKDENKGERECCKKAILKREIKQLELFDRI